MYFFVADSSTWPKGGRASFAFWFATLRLLRVRSGERGSSAETFFGDFVCSEFSAARASDWEEVFCFCCLARLESPLRVRGFRSEDEDSLLSGATRRLFRGELDAVSFERTERFPRDVLDTRLKCMKPVRFSTHAFIASSFSSSIRTSSLRR